MRIVGREMRDVDGRRRSPGRRLSPLAAAVAMLLAAAPPASAALSYVEGPKTTTAAIAQGEAQASCPPGAELTGGGTFSTGGYGDVSINSSSPYLVSETVWREFTDVYAGEQEHRAFAICDSNGTNQVIKFKELPANGGVETARARCPDGQNAYGGGFYTSASKTGVLAVASRPIDGEDRGGERDDGWEATYVNTTADPWSIRAFAQCGPRDVTVEVKSDTAGSASQKSLRQSCPRGDRVTGGGAMIEFAGSSGWINTVYPYDGGDAGSVRDDRWGAYFENSGVVERKVTVYAICR